MTEQTKLAEKDRKTDALCPVCGRPNTDGHIHNDAEPVIANGHIHNDAEPAKSGREN